LKKEKTYPPKLPLHFLRWFCREDYLEEIEGDLTEVFIKQAETSPRKAKWKFAWSVIKYFRPEFMKSFKNYQPNSYGMYRSYFKIGWRNLLKNKGYSFINIGGLALGMIVIMLIGLWVYDELTYNKYHRNYERIAQVVTHVSLDGETDTYSSLPFPAAEELHANYKSDFHAVAATASGDRIVSYEENVFTKRGCFSEYTFPKIASLEMKKGKHESFKDRSGMLLSESFAAAMFGALDPINKAVRIGNSDLSVVGIYEDLPRNSSFYGLHFIAPVDLLFSSQAAMNNWGSSSFQIYVLLNSNSTFEAASAKIRNVLLDHTQEATRPQLHLNPMARWHLYEFQNGENVPGRLQLVYIVGIIGVFILALACINFVSLSTARSEKRAKEIGVRKVLGSMKNQLINQFLCESFLVSLFAMVMAIAAVVMLLPLFNEFSNKQIEIPFTNPTLWFVVIASTVLVGLTAGSYPAFYLSAFKPVKVLKGAVNAGRASSTPRRILVVVQFSISVLLIIGSLVTYNQIQFVKDRPTGYSREGLISVPLMTQEIFAQYNALRLELLKTHAVVQVSQSSSPTTDIFSSADNLDWEGKDPNRQLLFGTVCIDPYFDEVVLWKVKAGRNFSVDIASDTTGFIFNEAATRQMGLTDPIGKTVRWHNKTWNIIGVVHDLVMTSPFDEAMPTVFMIDNRERPFNYMNIRLSPSHPTSSALTKVEKVFKKITPNTPFDYRFADQEYAAKFAAEESVGKLVFAFTVLAILISCLGLLGLASFVAEQRTKEIGIRKVLGASVAQVWQLVSYEFLVLVVIACVLAIPVSWYMMSNWLLQYDYRMELGWHLFAAAAGFAIVITLITVSYHALTAAMMNPVNSLKSE
jgi:putative ABC transport system permease protein